MKPGDLGQYTDYAAGSIKMPTLSRLRKRGAIPPVSYIIMV
jgi:hypothetical protein